MEIHGATSPRTPAWRPVHLSCASNGGRLRSQNLVKYFSSVTGRAALERFHFPIVNEFFAVHFLHFFSFNGVRAPLPAEVRDFIHGPDVRRWIAMAVQTETHA